ncbi:MAG: hypothetical protein U0904_07690 [Candidatus Nanopelagicales bacterium]|nr:hypothetical protein [Candidatus Nanopelagicales bacterium]
MMYGYGGGGFWMVLLWLVPIAIIAVIVWAVVKLAQGSGSGSTESPRPQTAEEILDRRLALGEIDPATHAQLREQLRRGGNASP